MFANSLRPLGRACRMTPSRFEKPAGCQQWLPKSPILATRTPRSKRSGSVRADGTAIYRDDLSRIIQMFTPKNKTPRTGEELGADEASEAGNLKANGTSPASMLFAVADQIIETFPSIMTRRTKHQAQARVLRLFLSALAAGRIGRAV
ncbi:hypothetical protein AB6Q56_08870 [Dechloromonas sp. ARDL1]|uniref:hypothetical protein n=1 Tax=Dechloromonas sp. ARDL1 TaxID=3322121 RepID=UPI003DA75BFD